MRKDFFLDSLDNKYYYKNVNDIKNSDEFYNIVDGMLSNEWSIKKSGIYFTCTNKKNNIPITGWKIHVSATLTNSTEILNIVTKLALENSFSFKFMLDSKMLTISSQKGYSRGSSGKFITIYPKDTNDFIKLLDILYCKLKNFAGPYILSDKRYRDCKVLYYRYGGMIGQFRMESDGDLVPIIQDGNGNWIDDIRTPYFKIPTNIENPVKKFLVDTKESYLQKNYKINKSLIFSNSGGVYEATRIYDNKKVIIKEARPYTCFIDYDKDAVYLRKKEFEFLQRLEKYNMTPKPIELFLDWEHTFLVEEFIEGITLYKFCAENNPFYRTFKHTNCIDSYINNLINIFIKIVDFLKIIHENDFIASDLSPNNIMLTSNLDVKFIDLEACLEKNDESFSQMPTIGFNEKITQDNFTESDLYALGCIFFSCLIRVNEMILLDTSVIEKFLNSLLKDFLLPKDLIDIILDLTQKNAKSRPSLDDVKRRLSKIQTRTYSCCKIETKYNYNDLNLKYKNLINECLMSIDKTSDKQSQDRLFPNTPFINNPLNVTCGALGNIHMFKWLQQSKKVEDYMPWITEKLCKTNLYPPGLYVGIAGIAWVLLEIGYKEKAIELLNICDRSKLFNNNFGIRCGLSGYGLALLKFWIETRNKRFLEKSISIGDELISYATIDYSKGFAFWYEGKKSINIGYGDGASGISLFLLYLYLASNKEKYLEIGRLALKYDLLHKIKLENSDFYSFAADNTCEKPLYPYFMKGNAGIISVLLRYYTVTNDCYYLDEINNLLPGIYVKYAVNPGLFCGLTALGNTLLDCYQFLGNIIYKNMAYDVAEGIYLYRIISPDGVLFPGDYISRLSTDFGSGTSGILLFFNRLLKNDMNFCFFLDELFINNNIVESRNDNEG